MNERNESARVMMEQSERIDAGVTLAGTFDRLLRLLEAHAERARAAASAGPPSASAPAEPPPAIDRLRTRLGLTPFECEVLAVCAAVELDGRFRSACIAANGNAGMPFATFGLVLNALPDPDWRVLSPSSALRYWQLIELGPGSSLVEAPLRIDDAVLQCVLGAPAVDSRIVDLTQPVRPLRLSDSQRNVVRAIVGTWEGARTPPLIQLLGSEPATGAAVAAEACASVGVPLRAISLPALLARGATLERDIRLIARQMLLDDGALFIDEGETNALEPTARAWLERLIERVGGALFLAVREPFAARTRQAASFTVRKPTAHEQRTLWTAHVGEPFSRLAGRLATQFDFDAPRIDFVAQTAAAALVESPVPVRDFASTVWSNARRVSRVGLEGLAQLVESRAAWDALVVPQPVRETLGLIVEAARGRSMVYDDWGFGGRDARGLGITALFAGPSGTGKTMAAEVLANRLEVDLYRVDLSAVVSKYIGETEKNLRRIFDAAEAGGAILLFDEADALFGKRSEVKDSHDRHANVEVSYLLQRMETYRGVAILTTNVKDALDKAFLRRLRFVVAFPFPDAAHREAIWRGVFPARTPLHELDFSRLAQLDVAGGNICNIALNAAFLAAADNGAVTMAHLLAAARIEYAKIEKTLPAGEIAGWHVDRTPGVAVAR